MKKIIFSVCVVVLNLVVAPAFAQTPSSSSTPSSSEGLVTCGGYNQPDCTYNDIVPMINNIINKGLLFIIIPILTILIIVGGFKMLTAGGNESKFKSGVDMIKGVAWGFGFALLAWVIVRTIVSFLGLTTN